MAPASVIKANNFLYLTVPFRLRTFGDSHLPGNQNFNSIKVKQEVMMEDQNEFDLGVANL